MKIILKGEFDKEDFISKLSNELHQYIPTDFTAYGTLYLSLKDNDGKRADYYDEEGESLSVVLTNYRPRKHVSPSTIGSIIKLHQNGKTVAEIYTVEWSGTTVDVNYYDGSKPATKVFISGDFVFDNGDE